MFAKVLFFDTNVLLKLFIDEQGSTTSRWLTSGPVKVSNGLTFHINPTVIYEFGAKLVARVESGLMTVDRATAIKAKFDRYYQDKWFKVADQNLRSATRRNMSLEAIFRTANFRLYCHNRDAAILHAIVNSLGSLAGQSHPILVTCDRQFARGARRHGYRTINPVTQSRAEILSVIRMPR